MTTNSIYRRHVSKLSRILRKEKNAVRHLVEQGTEDLVSFGRFIVVNQLSCYLMSQLVRHNIEAPTAWSEIVERQQRQSVNTQRLVANLERVHSLLTDLNCPFVLLKGVYLAERFYGGRSHRNFWDVDILVKETDAERVDVGLKVDGYYRRSSVLLSPSLSRRFTHAFDYAGEGSNLDLHWTLTRQPSVHLDYLKLWQSASSYCISGKSYRVLSDEYELVFSMLSIVRDIERGGLRIRSLVDLFAILEAVHNTVDWRRFFADRKKENISALCANVLALTLNALDCWKRFPEVSGVIENHPDVVPRQLDSTDDHVFYQPGFGFGDKLWAARVYGMSRFGCLSWWAVSLPFRLVVYKPGKLARLRRSLTARGEA